MATFKRCDLSEPLRYSDYLNKKKWYKVDGELTQADVNQLNNLNGEFVLIFENTKGMNSEIIRQLDPRKFDISVMGGLNYIERPKYRDSDYIDRTLYSPQELYKVIKEFEKIERQIDYSWTETQKCLFVYKTLAEKMHIFNPKFDYAFINSKDVCRSLHGLVTNYSVCAGFSLIFKEAMDRLGIECLYQNKRHDHCWNAVKLDGKYHLIDLTWDVSGKKNNQCQFYYFCRQNSGDFYKGHHDITGDSEEIRVPAQEMPVEEIANNYRKILGSKQKYSGAMSGYRNNKGETYYYSPIAKKDGIIVYMVVHNGSINYYYLNEKEDIKNALERGNLDIVSNQKDHNISGDILPETLKRFKTYRRNDGSSFVVLRTKTGLKNGLNEYYCIEPCIRDGQLVLKRETILSESDLISDEPDFKYFVANYLISRERLQRKVDHFNGYVGYLGRNSQVYYNSQFEREELGIQERVAQR